MTTQIDTNSGRRSEERHLLLGWLKSALQYDAAAAALSTMAAGLALAVGAHVLLPGPQRSSAPGGGTESTEQTLDLDEISLWLESDRLSSRPEGKGLQPEQRHREHRPDVRRENTWRRRSDRHSGRKTGKTGN